MNDATVAQNMFGPPFGANFRITLQTKQENIFNYFRATAHLVLRMVLPKKIVLLFIRVGFE